MPVAPTSGVCWKRAQPLQRPGDSGGGGARSRRHSRSTWVVAPGDGMSILAAVPDQLEPEGYPTQRADLRIQSNIYQKYLMMRILTKIIPLGGLKDAQMHCVLYQHSSAI